VPTPPPSNLGISDYTGWRSIVYDSRGELQSQYKTDFSADITSNLGQNPTGAILLKCKDSAGTITFTISISLRGNVSVITY
jgi:hypothetical protein